ncbi:hypothetical protein FACS189465_2230 [Clostridia bacterium]|uniref:Uncharacterized protein n=1 Tax=Candidatus Paraimprobicoccus trichonymphae TaxID=3033793 RepID=A0AA48I4X6_9FIRM|nr:MAG: hypothetical protein RsTaC01_0913 [Candidatus Paraimprobicoccus trichonymphae]GHV24752.1 hypothetical protein FACS189465_2230 [Clostridia bacterium]
MIDKMTHLEVGSEKYPLAFTINVMEAIQEQYGTIEDWSKLVQNAKEPNLKAVKFFMLEAINEGIDIENEKSGKTRKPINSKQVGRILTDYGIANTVKKLRGTITNSISEGKTSKNE